MAPSRRCAAALVAATVVLTFPVTTLGDEARDALIVETVLRIEERRLVTRLPIDVTQGNVSNKTLHVP